MPNSYAESTYIEGGYLAGGWRYRIQRLAQVDRDPVYTGLLLYEGELRGRDLRFVCLSEYSTLGEARAAVYENLPAATQALLRILKWPSSRETEKAPS